MADNKIVSSDKAEANFAKLLQEASLNDEQVKAVLTESGIRSCSDKRMA